MGNSIAPGIQFCPSNAAIFEENGRASGVLVSVALYQLAKGQLFFVVLDPVVVKPFCHEGKFFQTRGQAAHDVACGYDVLAHGASVSAVIVFYGVEPRTNPWLRG